MKKEIKYEAGDHVVKTEGERKHGTVLPPEQEGGDQRVRWGDGSITPLTHHPIAPSKEHMS